MVDITNPRQPLPASIVARRVGVSRQLLADWVRRGKLQPADHAANGRPLYRVVDAAVVERQTRKSEQANGGSFCRGVRRAQRGPVGAPA